MSNFVSLSFGPKMLAFLSCSVIEANWIFLDLGNLFSFGFFSFGGDGHQTSARVRLLRVEIENETSQRNF